MRFRHLNSDRWQVFYHEEIRKARKFLLEFENLILSAVAASSNKSFYVKSNRNILLKDEWEM